MVGMVKSIFYRPKKAYLGQVMWLCNWDKIHKVVCVNESTLSMIHGCILPSEHSIWKVENKDELAVIYVDKNMFGLYFTWIEAWLKRR